MAEVIMPVKREKKNNDLAIGSTLLSALGPLVSLIPGLQPVGIGMTAAGGVGGAANLANEKAPESGPQPIPSQQTATQRRLAALQEDPQTVIKQSVIELAKHPDEEFRKKYAPILTEAYFKSKA